MFYVGRQITVTFEGSVWKPIRCAFCQLEWAYRMTRQQRDLRAMGAWWIRKAPRSALSGKALRILKAPRDGSKEGCR